MDKSTTSRHRTRYMSSKYERCFGRLVVVSAVTGNETFLACLFVRTDPSITRINLLNGLLDDGGRNQCDSCLYQRSPSQAASGFEGHPCSDKKDALNMGIGININGPSYLPEDVLRQSSTL